MSMLSTSQASRLLNIAFVIAHEGQITSANAIFQAFLDENENHVPALLGTGLTKLMTDKFDEGEEVIKKVLEAHPDDLDALALLALGYYVADDSFKAKEMAQKVLDSDNEAVDAKQLAEEVLKQIG